jgi:malate dehydrogenase (oxaloacetate-decarboxylating)
MAISRTRSRRPRTWRRRSTSHGFALLHDPWRNRGTAFTEAERRALGLDGLLPPVVETIEQQVARAYEVFRRQGTDLGKHVYLRALQDRNETLYGRLVLEHVEEMLPIVYTPTVGQACQQYSHVYQRNRGLFLSYPLRDRLEQVLGNRPWRDVDVIVVTDGERILGLGDQGVGGLGIPIGKLSLYTLIGGIHPSRTLPIVLDVGTNNPALIADPEYIGWRHERIRGEAYFDFVERFVQAVERTMPRVLLQWEDFAGDHAATILDLYRDRLLTFNDDIQGTAVVALATLLGAVAAKGETMRQQRVVILGAGSAGLGVASMIRDEMVAEGADPAEARRRLFLVDSHGLLLDRRTDLNAAKRAWALPAEALNGWSGAAGELPDLAAVVEHAGPTVLIGLSTAAGAFGEALVRRMAAAVSRPVILPLSNPTARSEADPADLMRWTDGRAMVATGSPYPPVRLHGREVAVAQCNNVFVFPGIGLGAVAARATRVTDGMLTAAARALAARSPVRRDPEASLLPPVDELRHVAGLVALAVAAAAVRDGVAPHASEATLRRRVAAARWTPAYH